MFSVPKLSEARGNAGAASVAVLCGLSFCAGGAYAVDAARHAPRGGRHVVPVPRIGQRPNSRTDLRWALFTYTDKEPRVHFECSIDGSKYSSCSSRAIYGLIEAKLRSGSRCHKNCSRGAAKRSRRANKHAQTRSVLRGAGNLLGLGRHVFHVRAKSKTGRQSRPATFAWMILTKAELEAAERAQSQAGAGSGGGGSSAGGSESTIGGSGGSSGGSGGSSGGGSGGSGGGGSPIARTKGFVISGQPEGTLYPGGAALPIPLTLFNPNPIPIHVTSLTVAVASSPEGCAAETNLRLTQSDASSEQPVTVPADAAVTLPTQGVSAPAIALLNLPVNQDACQNATFPLVYTGSAHS
jgi:hypothetical protein